ncbi:MAG: EF-hand domain-containing protein [bacterium]|nr:EF-hand domain-containing protein [bacterium]
MTSGCSGNSIYRFMLFVNDRYNGDINQAFDAADNNHNGTITKYEIKCFLNGLGEDNEWGLCKDNTSDIFKAFNTCTQGRGQVINDDDEVDKKYKTLIENFGKVSEAIEKYAARIGGMPEGITTNKLIDALANKFNKNLKINNLDNALPKLFAQAVATIYKDDALKTVASTYDVPNGYDATSDNNLTSLLNNYINGLKVYANGIKDDINDIIEAYIEGTSLTGDLEPYSWDPDEGINDLLKQEILNNVKSVVMETEIWIEDLNFVDSLDQAISDFIDEKLTENPNWSFNEGLILEEFKNSKSGQVFLISTIYTDFWTYWDADGVDTSDLYYDEIANAFGDDFATKLTKGEKAVSEYQDILQQVAEMVKNGEVKPDKAVQKIIELINEKYTEISKKIGHSESDSPIQLVYTLFTNAYDDGNGDIESVKEAAIKFLDAVKARNIEKWNIAIDNNCPDYHTMIDSLSRASDVYRLIENVINTVASDGAIILDMKNVYDINAMFYNEFDPIQVNSGSSITGQDVKMGVILDQCGQSFIPEVLSDYHRVTYRATSNKGLCTNVTITNDGKLSFKAGNTKGTDTITVKALVYGQEISTRNITVNVV